MAIRPSVSLPDPVEHALARAFQVVLLGILSFGIFTGRPSIAINAGGAVIVSVLPAVVRHEVDLHVDYGLVFWLTAAVSLHAIGIVGPYRTIWWWDYLTHALSASIVTGIAYAVVRTIDRHSERIRLPEPAYTVVLLFFVLALGVLWEVLEFGATLASDALGTRSPLIVFGVADIITDLVFTAVGGLLVILWGRGYFRSLSRKLGGVLFHRAPD